jgi:hypothetical protein
VIWSVAAAPAAAMSAQKRRSVHAITIRPDISDFVSKAIELARTLKPDDAMRVRANDVKVTTGTRSSLCTPLYFCQKCLSASLEIIFSNVFRAQSFGVRWRVCFVRLKAAIWIFCVHRQLWTKTQPCGLMPVMFHFGAHVHFTVVRLQVPPILRYSLSIKKDAKGKTKVSKQVSAPKEPPTVFDMAPVWFRLCCALVDNPKEDAVQTLRDMNRVSNIGINMTPSDLNIGALASLQVTNILMSFNACA